ncbi:MAG: hypothetical protein LLG00_04560 [Planctomycetaceae bacterium]|nr:hypothetical protein [Planctomycetaceae bacterium]
MMSLLISLPIIVLATWLIFKSFRGLWRRKKGRRWCPLFVTLLIGGAYAGFCLGCCDVHVTPTFRWVGLPLPVCFFQLEDRQWVDFVPPAAVQLTNRVADALTPIIIVLAPLIIADGLLSRRARLSPIPNRLS